MNLTKGLSKEQIAKLTALRDNQFRIIFTSQIEPSYNFSSINTAKINNARNLSDKEKSILKDALHKFIEISTNRTITEVDENYARTTDSSDRATDLGEEFGMIHYGVVGRNDNDCEQIAKAMRLHGYMRDGVFVVKRIDWIHRFHPRKSRTKAN